MDEILTSASNSTVKRLRMLIKSGKARRDENTYVAEGIHLARSFLATSGAPQLYVCAESALRNPEIIQLIYELENRKTQYVTLSDNLFESITNIHAPVGILLLFSPAVPSTTTTMPLVDSTILLEDVQDPGNIGTILRTAAAIGVKHVILSPGCASPWSPKALRAGMGAQFGLAIHESADLAEIIATAEVPTLATTLAPGSESLYAIDLRRPVAWLFGSEGQGVSEHLALRASTRVLIPQAETSVESLNVAAAAAVCLYEHYRQNNA